jgi:hypothetical protein
LKTTCPLRWKSACHGRSRAPGRDDGAAVKSHSILKLYARNPVRSKIHNSESFRKAPAERGELDLERQRETEKQIDPKRKISIQKITAVLM